ncbi:MAG: GNAT family N-acetyltransferase [Jatrophihabitantaceae bacterium]
MGTSVTENREQHRFEIRVDGALAGFATFRLDGGTVTFPHTEIEDRFGGQGLGSTLVRAALDDARDRGWTVVAQCPFVGRFIEDNPEYQDLVAGF